MNLKKIIRKAHLWLGFSSGIVVFIVSLTGCIYAFQQEIQDMVQPYRFVEHVGETPLSIHKIKAIAESELDGKKARRIYRFSDDRAIKVLFYGKGYYHAVFVDPYTGAVLKSKDMYYDFFTIVLELHRHLLIPGDVGELIVPIATLVFLILMFTGVYLWWPKNLTGAKKRLKIAWNVKWQRKNYDLHTVLGFYSTWVLIFIAITGLVWGFTWFDNGLYFVTSGGKTLEERPKYSSDTTQVNHVLNPYDKVYSRLKSESEQYKNVVFLLPKETKDPLLVLTNDYTDRYQNMEYHYYDQHTLEKFKTPERLGPFDEASTALKIRKLNYDIHTGSVFGLFGKFIAFFASLISTSLPITGFIMWKGRRKNKRMPKEKKEAKLVEEMA